MLKFLVNKKEEASVREEACKILKRIGTVNSIAPLQVVAATARERHLQDAAKSALLEIQRRR